MTSRCALPVLDPSRTQYSPPLAGQRRRMDNACTAMNADVPMTSSCPTPVEPPMPATAEPARVPTPSFLRQTCQAISIAALALASYLVITHFFLQSVQVVGVSMSPTLADSQHYLLNRWIYLIRAPRRREIVVLRDPADHEYAVKRIIAAEGDSVYLNDGNVYLNGRRIAEPYLQPGMPTYPFERLKDQFFECGKDQYFVLGDNRMNSADSRTYGLVPRRNIMGVIIR
jgi:signal peptidase I